jgi:hypothetical protein
MARSDSVRRFASALVNALADGDFDLADRCVERLKMLLLEAVIDSDGGAVAQIEALLAEAGEHFELKQRLRMEDGAQAIAWRLRSDAGTATLATRIRPAKPPLDTTEEGTDLRKRILKLLREANRAMPNNAIAERVGRDAPSVCRVLKSMSAAGLIRQWKVGKNQLNALTELGRGMKFHPIDCLAVSKELVSGADRLPKAAAVADVPSVPSLRLANATAEKRSALTGEPLGPLSPPRTRARGSSEHLNDHTSNNRVSHAL